MFGPVSMSANYPRALIDTLVFFYQRYYASDESLAEAYHPFQLSEQSRCDLQSVFAGLDREQGFDRMQKIFEQHGQKLPILFKQYAALFEEQGFKALVFSVDPDFGDCLDGMCMGDMSKLKASRKKRYIVK